MKFTLVDKRKCTLGDLKPGEWALVDDNLVYKTYDSSDKWEIVASQFIQTPDRYSGLNSHKLECTRVNVELIVTLK